MKKTLDSYLSSWFSRIGKFVGEYPQHCIAATLLFTVILGTGFLNFSRIKDLEYLYNPRNSRVLEDRKFIENLFSNSYRTDDEIIRMSTYQNLITIIVLAKNNGFMLDPSSIEDVIQMDVIIRNISIFWNKKFYSYRDICIKNNRNECAKNFVSSLKYMMKHPGKVSMRYPVERTGFDVKINAMNVGGVSTNDTGYITDFKAVRLFYFMDFETEKKKRVALKWEEEFLNIMTQVEFRHIDVSFFTLRSVNAEANRNTELSIPLAFIITPIVIFFSVASCMTFDIVSSKPWIGLAACCSPLLALIAAFGLLLHCGIEYSDVNITMTFLLLGIGLDDSFVLLAAWRRTNVKDSTIQRMSHTFSEAGVSIAITSLTNIASFCVGITSPFRVVRIYCMYGALSVLFDFVYQIFFFGSLMALDGHREKHRLNPFLCYTVKETHFDNETSKVRQDETYSNKCDRAVKYLSEKLGSLLCRKSVKMLIVFMFVCNIAGSIYSIKDMKQGLDLKEIFPFSSPITKFINNYYSYFTDYPHVIQVVFNQTLDYSNPSVQEEVENILSMVQNAPYISGREHFLCWIREYLSFIHNNDLNYLMKDFNTSDSRGFVQGLKQVFLRFQPAIQFRKDLSWDRERNQIVASRCFVSSKGVRTGTDEKLLLEGLRQIADRSKYRVIVYNILFAFYEQSLNLTAICLQNVGVAVFVVSLIFLLMIQDIPCTVCVSLNVVCILVETMGYMNWWHVKLDLMSVLILMMSAGLCIDFSAHVAYAYKCCQKESSEEKIKYSLNATGYPIMQNCLSTLLGVIVLAFGPSYTFVIFFKIILLIMVFAALNGLLLLPVLLIIGESIVAPWKKKSFPFSQ
ncbi:patched domain-containing protein 3-like [Centruroides sculpturatus]|uniref:patched domain-containing protein 3-like n=1 Tax=Centruroides sculpturatus TaxID=218467 RepID=UPI000C6E1D3C|nr:patched domain-containing protein 3-like [Centruroides sculpturatus]